ncbi:c-type cytochrome [Halomonas huangheensis]|uniref:Cytochrome c domain-containing protein n=1 Tax=Halomonas huangheensis TaxID=1178482 RepID=W1N3W8_9GAMM|nr:c-type cytochrome [Halomonas huangheensis]ALM51392.1 hypothetical protein AR456_03090 [Halomonas huangheensis]ERL49836.1 hypothetical protein BJB45_01565 [Halomonas huangheensis]
MISRILGGLLLSLAADISASFGAEPDSSAQGERVFRNQCQGCHSLEPGVHIAGPSLHGVVGRNAGTVADFEYSAPLQQAQLVWTPEVLDRFLAAPDDFLPGTRMVFWGLDEDSRHLLIDYLEWVGKR